MTERQQATIIAALRHFRRPQHIDRETREIATNGGKFLALSWQEIDELIEQLPGNHPPVADRLSEFKAEFDAKLAAMSDDDIVNEFAALGIAVTVRKKELPPLDGVRLQFWEAMRYDTPGQREDDEAFLKAVDASVRVFRRSDCPAVFSVGQFVVTMKDPDASAPPCNFVAWRVVEIDGDDVSCVMDPVESEHASIVFRDGWVRDALPGSDGSRDNQQTHSTNA